MIKIAKIIIIKSSIHPDLCSLRGMTHRKIRKEITEVGFKPGEKAYLINEDLYNQFIKDNIKCK